MDSEPTRIGLAISALGGVLTAFAVYQPFYGLAFTPAGISAASQEISSLPGLSSYADRFSAAASGLAGHTIAGVTAHQAFHVIGIALLVIAAVAILTALAGLVSTSPLLGPGAGQLLVGVGVIGALLIAFRMVSRPIGDNAFITLSLRPGAPLALAGCAAIAAGALLPERRDAADPEPAPDGDVWSGLSGWTPS